ncbi:MAG: hypothetical protein R2684_08550 [Pyrinomonadaceae bacterium]
MAFQVVVADNFHYMDESEFYIHGTFETLELAIEAAKKIVDSSLDFAYKPGMTASELYSTYTTFGEDPFVKGGEIGTVPFSAWKYAEIRCSEICGESEEEE